MQCRPGRLRQWFADLSLYKKIMLIVSVSLFCVYLAFYAGVRFLSRSYEAELYASSAQTLSNAASAISAEMQAVEAVSDNLIDDTAIQENLYELKSIRSGSGTARLKRNVYQALYAYTFFNSYIKSIHVILPDGGSICMGNSEDIKDFSLETLVEKAGENKGGLDWSPSVSSGGAVVCYRQFLQQKYLTFEKLADVYIVVDMEALVADALKKSGYSTENMDFVLLEGRTPICPGQPLHTELYEEIFTSMEASGHSYHIMLVDGKETFVISGTLPDTGWSYLAFRDYDPLFRSIRTTKTRVLFFLVCSGLVALLAIRFVLKRIFRHLSFLLEKIQDFGSAKEPSKPPLSYDYSGRKDEIGQLHLSFDQMTQRVTILRNQNYEKQLLLKDATIKLLRQQINPHFLYNTLDTINWMAQKYGVNEISVMAKSLASLFRASVKGEEDLIPLAEELSVLDCYVRIQEIRFRDRLRFVSDIPEHIEHIYVPKLCIQPLVENALKHAVEDTDEPCTVRVSVKTDSGCCIICVSNTGSAFSEELLEGAGIPKAASGGTGIGLSNINSRLRLLFGEEYGLKFFNQDDMAVVILKIPQDPKHSPPAL